MKIKRKPFIQQLAHEVEDEDKAWEHIDQSLPMIGKIVMYFNGLEKLLDQMLCDIFSDRSDAPGLIVLQNMQYSAKVNLFARFSDEFHRAVGAIPEKYESLTDKLRTAAKNRNIVVHADWENTDDDGFTYSTIRFADGGMQQEYVQLSPSTLDAILGTILEARVQLGEYYDVKAELLTR
jgi:hypothetical protein